MEPQNFSSPFSVVPFLFLFRYNTIKFLILEEKTGFMKRTTIPPRNDADMKAHDAGVYMVERTIPDGNIHRSWDETSAYILTKNDVNAFIQKVSPIIEMSRNAVDFLLDGEWGTLGTTRPIFEFARNSFDDQELDLFTRYDFAYLGDDDIKLVGIEADAPRYFIEAAHTQRSWILEKFPQQTSQHKFTQLNSIPELTIQAFEKLHKVSDNKNIHIANGSDIRGEDAITAAYIKGLMKTAGWAVGNVRVKDLHWNNTINMWADGKENNIYSLYKHFPWDMLLTLQIARDFVSKNARLEILFEPAWKMILSSRAILPALWELYPDSELLSPSMMSEHGEIKGDKVIAPLMASTSRNEVGIWKERQFTSWGEDIKNFSNSNLVQRKLEIPRRYRDQQGGYRFAYISVFTVAGRLAGVGIRETRLPLLGTYSTFKPHIVQL